MLIKDIFLLQNYLISKIRLKLLSMYLFENISH